MDHFISKGILIIGKWTIYGAHSYYLLHGRWYSKDIRSPYQRVEVGEQTVRGLDG